ncbi:DUF4169 family protein [Henriciella marina]|uniref:DUF4169 family protein n=1 Tax=Henriciella marina TaxID=453851 RepID=UPI00036DC228|nr:DUF4169 family protein [Henriciella marina]
MTTPINLNKVRKDKERAASKKQAAENRVKFGRTKIQKLAEKADAARLRKTVDLAKKEQERSDRRSNSES